MSTTPSNPVQSCQPKGESLPERLRTMPSSLNDACRTMDEAAERIEELTKALSAAGGYLRNASIDLSTGATKATAIKTIEGGLKLIDAVLEPKGAEPRSDRDMGTRMMGSGD